MKRRVAIKIATRPQHGPRRVERIRRACQRLGIGAFWLRWTSDPSALLGLPKTRRQLRLWQAIRVYRRRGDELRLQAELVRFAEEGLSAGMSVRLPLYQDEAKLVTNGSCPGPRRTWTGRLSRSPPDMPSQPLPKPSASYEQVRSLLYDKWNLKKED